MMRRAGFTLTELLITVAIIGIMATMVLFAMFNAQEAAKVHKTRALIAKLNDIVMRRYDEFRTRRAPIDTTHPFVVSDSTASAVLANPVLLARARVDVMRDLMRLELPDRWSDIEDDPVTPFEWPSTPVDTRIKRPAISEAYLARVQAARAANQDLPTTENQGAECLYLIVMATLAEEGSTETFKPDDIADTDGDGFPEFVDAWKRPIEFIRWAPAYLSDLQTPFRLEGTSTQVDANTVTVRVTASHVQRRLSQTPGSYIGGAIAFLHNESKAIDPEKMGRIAGYRYDLSTSPPIVEFTCTTPPGAPSPFGGTAPNGEFVLMMPDPFDSRGVYPRYDLSSPPHIANPTYAIYPLIISRGPDGAMGVKDGAGGSTILRYASERLNPFYVAPAVNHHPMMLGSVFVQDDGEPNWKRGCDKDNITNHDLTSR
jgi:prepilin-type N-terminal cleavage/methylation domain-containing protein